MMQPWDPAENLFQTSHVQTTNVADESPLWPTATNTMKIDVAVNKDSKVWVLHNQPFPDYLEWIEFDAETQMMTFITAGGKLQDLGVPIHAPMDDAVSRAREIYTIYMRDGQIRDLGIVPLTVRQNTSLFREGQKS